MKKKIFFRKNFNKVFKILSNFYYDNLIYSWLVFVFFIIGIVICFFLANLFDSKDNNFTFSLSNNPRFQIESFNSNITYNKQGPEEIRIWIDFNEINPNSSNDSIIKFSIKNKFKPTKTGFSNNFLNSIPIIGTNETLYEFNINSANDRSILAIFNGDLLGDEIDNSTFSMNVFFNGSSVINEEELLISNTSDLLLNYSIPLPKKIYPQGWTFDLKCNDLFKDDGYAKVSIYNQIGRAKREYMILFVSIVLGSIVSMIIAYLLDVVKLFDRNNMNRKPN